MTYKGFRIDKKRNVYDLGDKLMAENVESVDKAKELVDEYIERKKNPDKKPATQEQLR